MQVLYERCAAVDVGKDVIAVAVRVPGDGPGGRRTVKRTFGYGTTRLPQEARPASPAHLGTPAVEAPTITDRNQRFDCP